MKIYFLLFSTHFNMYRKQSYTENISSLSNPALKLFSDLASFIKIYWKFIPDRNNSI